MSTQEVKWGTESKRERKELRGEVRIPGHGFSGTVTVTLKAERGTLDNAYRWSFEAIGSGLSAKSTYRFSSSTEAKRVAILMATAILEGA